MSCDVRVSLNFHEIDTNSRKFYPENLVFQDNGFYTKFFYHKNLEPYSSSMLHCVWVYSIILQYVTGFVNVWEFGKEKT